jgi:glycosyltransferase involved in cell wall biosynthesis
MNAVTWLNAKLARRIITISEYSKKDLVEIYRIRPENIEVTYIGCNSEVFNSSPPDPEVSSKLLARLGIRQPYILHHGIVEIRKNLHRLIEAWERVRGASSDLDLQLVLAGGLGYGRREILTTREASSHRDQIVLPGMLSDTELGTLVKNATLCVIPSLYEGFCLPMVEAMACGVPTVASNASCIPEVSGGVLKYFDPHSIDEMAETIRLALEDSSVRDRLRCAGLARAAEFSWERCARETLRIFAETAASS